jgi:outer membrane autotransporter protein
MSLSPYADLSYSESRQDAYTESGGGFPSRFDARTSKATDLRLGLNAGKPLNANTRLLGKLEGVHRFQERGADLSGTVSGVSFSFDAPDAEQDWLRAGVGMEHDTQSGRFNVMINATSKGEEPSAWVAVSYQANF